MLADQILVRRLRIRANTADRSAAQRRAAALTATADLHGAHLGPAAILCIRKLDDPKPRSLNLSSRGLRAPGAWEAAARSRVAELSARAVRPVHGPVAPTALAVLFADRAELLACLARDWCDGALSASWWWQALFPNLEDAAAVIKGWRGEPRSVPAALHRMSAGGHLQPFLARLPASEATALAAQIATLFQVPELTACVWPVVEAAMSGATSAPIVDTAGTVAAAPSSRRARVRGEPLAAALRRYVPELEHGRGSVDTHAFAATALLVHRAPPHRVASLVRNHIAVVTDVPSRSPIATPGTPMPGPLRHVESADAGVTGVAEPEPLSEEAPASVSTAARPAVTHEAVDVPTHEWRSRVPGSRGHDAVQAELVVESEFAGALYLVNVAIALGYYGDFTQPLTRGLDLSIWEFLGRLARRLVPAAAFDADALAPLLARLAGDDEEPDAAWDAWFDAHVPVVRERLAAALGIDPERVGPFVVERRGQLRLTATELHVCFDLATLPIEIRMSGLDRDPGFVPAAGLSIAFVYV